MALMWIKNIPGGNQLITHIQNTNQEEEVKKTKKQKQNKIIIIKKSDSFTASLEGAIQ